MATRGYDLGVEVYGPDVAHALPVVILTGSDGQTITVADSYDNLVRDFETIIDRVKERQGQ